ncbi:MAG: hypothetical protein ACE5JG_08205 [Planctomycetota bacterium]
MTRWLGAVLLALCACDVEIARSHDGRDPSPVHDAKALRAALEIQRLTAELEQYHARRGEWPDGWRQLGRSGVDPWGTEYRLEIVQGRAAVSSAGPDGEPDTGDDVHGGVR